MKEIIIQKREYNQSMKEIKSIYKDDWFDVTHEGFLAIAQDGERMSDWEFYGQKFQEENLIKMIETYPQAKSIMFSSRLNARSEENKNESGYPLDYATMSFIL
jgi:hypothetical protein